jgi:hypothetical protein
MNPRFEDLKRQAFEMTELEELDYDVILERFGQLVIQECIHVMHNQERLPQGFLYAKSASLHEVAIQDHFGVKA